MDIVISFLTLVALLWGGIFTAGCIVDRPGWSRGYHPSSTDVIALSACWLLARYGWVTL